MNNRQTISPPLEGPGEDKTRTLTNETTSISVDFLGGAITSFSLKDNPLNPLSFRFDPHHMPSNNKSGAPYQGHFVCLGRWGRPTPGKITKGIPDHGQFANMLWTDAASDLQNHVIRMEANSPMESLHLHRTLSLDHSKSIVRVEETVTNPGPLSRFYQLVQHPTLAAPFARNEVILCANAQLGFNQVHASTPEQFAQNWPEGIDKDGSIIWLDQFEQPYNAVFSLIAEPNASFGWITAYSPKDNLLFDYVWPRAMYP